MHRPYDDVSTTLERRRPGILDNTASPSPHQERPTNLYINSNHPMGMVLNSQLVVHTQLQQLMDNFPGFSKTTTVSLTSAFRSQCAMYESDRKNKLQNGPISSVYQIFFLLWHAPQGVHSAKCRHQSPECYQCHKLKHSFVLPTQRYKRDAVR